MSTGTTSEGKWTRISGVAAVVGVLIAVVGLAQNDQPPPPGQGPSSPASPTASVPAVSSGRPSSGDTSASDQGDEGQGASVYHQGVLTIRKGGYINYDSEPDDISWRRDKSFSNVGYEAGRRLDVYSVDGLPVGRERPTYQECASRAAEYLPADEFDGTVVSAGSYYCLQDKGMYGMLKVIRADADAMRCELVTCPSPDTARVSDRRGGCKPSIICAGRGGRRRPAGRVRPACRRSSLLLADSDLEPAARRTPSP